MKVNVKSGRVVVAVVLGLASGSAMATGTGPRADAQASGVGIGVASANSGAFAGASNSGMAVGNANSAYGFGGNATALSGQGGTGFGTALAAPQQIASPTQSVVFQGNPAYQTITHNGRTQVETVPNVSAPGNWPTAPCSGSSSAGVGWMGFGMSGGTSWTDHECQLMEVSRQAPTVEDRVYVWCKAKSAQGSPSCARYEAQAATTEDRQAAGVHDRKVVAATESSYKPAPGADVWVLAPR